MIQRNLSIAIFLVVVSTAALSLAIVLTNPQHGTSTSISAVPGPFQTTIAELQLIGKMSWVFRRDIITHRSSLVLSGKVEQISVRDFVKNHSLRDGEHYLTDFRADKLSEDHSVESGIIDQFQGGDEIFFGRTPGGLNIELYLQTRSGNFSLLIHQ